MEFDDLKTGPPPGYSKLRKHEEDQRETSAAMDGTKKIPGQ
jgi:hypothetical protein